MPAPIAHLAYTQAWLEDHPELEAGRVLRGTVFPDIRYLAEFDRSRTHHPHEVSLGRIDQESNAWRVGFLLHNCVDDSWNAVMSQYGLTEREPADELTWSALKALEIRQIREVMHVSQQVAASLSVVDSEPLHYGVPAPMVKQWGALITADFQGSWMGPAWLTFARVGLKLNDQQIVHVRRQVNILEARGGWLNRLIECREALVRELRGWV